MQMRRFNADADNDQDENDLMSGKQRLGGQRNNADDDDLLGALDRRGHPKHGALVNKILENKEQLQYGSELNKQDAEFVS